VIVVDGTSGVMWELAHINRAGYSQKTLYLLPPHLTTAAGRFAQIIHRDPPDAERATNDQNAHSLIESLHGLCIGWYRTSSGKITLLTSRIPTETSYICALRHFASDVLVEKDA